ncbi:pyridoxal 5'-phosphate synthase lyase subunit PdxS, partial [Streptomyces collinus]
MQKPSSPSVRSPVSTTENQAPETGTARVKRGMAEQLKGGVIMD